MSVAGANDFQIPTNASVAFPIGTVINVIQIGAGQTTIKAVTSGTTTISSTGATATTPKLRAQFSAASCIKVATDTWYVVGDILTDQERYYEVKVLNTSIITIPGAGGAQNNVGSGNAGEIILYGLTCYLTRITKLNIIPYYQ